MKKFRRNSIGMVLAVAFTLGFAGAITVFALAPGAVELGTSANFSVLSGSGVADTNPSTITGDVGASPITGAAIAITAAEVEGDIYAVDGAGPVGSVEDPGLLITAKTDLSTAFGAITLQATDFSTDGDIGGDTLVAGVYEDDDAPNSLAITGTVTLDGGGDPNAVFVFKMGETLITANDSVVELINGAQACNVFWQVGSSATLGTNSTFAGTILAAASITDNGGSTVIGRLLADANDDDTGAVTLDNTTVTLPTCAPALTLNKTVDNTAGGTALDIDWTLTATGALGTPTNLSGSTTISSDVVFADATFKADTYTLAESGPADYEASAWSCVINDAAPVSGATVTLAASDVAVCTITNTYVVPPEPEPEPASSSSGGSSRRVEPATLRVIKRVVNNSGGTAQASSFNLHVKRAGTEVVGSPSLGTVSPGRLYTLTVGTYVVSEDAADGSYMPSFSGDCDANGRVTLAAGDNKTCTIINDDIVFGAVFPVPGLPNTGLADGRGLTRAEAQVSFPRSLSLTTEGADVVILQVALLQRGLLKMPPGVAYGYFGSLTRAAVLKYQARTGLPLAGVFGPMTKAQLISELGE